MLLSIRKITKQYDGKTALVDVSLDIATGEIVCLLGPSGCGKTTLLRIIAGLEPADAGRVFCEEQDMGATPPHQRDFGLMFQDYALFPHKNVFDNVAFGLRMERESAEILDFRLPVLDFSSEQEIENPKSKIQNRVQEMLALVGLEGFEERSVNDLSGGEAQRVALARSLAPRPRLLMLDEPLGSLDRALRERLMVELRDILKTVGVTALYVTHDQAEAFAIADRVVVMNAGRIEQVGPPETIYRNPATPFVANFLGLTNLAEGRVIGPNRVASAWGELAVVTDHYQSGDLVAVLIRPEAARLSPTAPQDTRPSNKSNFLRGQLVACSFRGRSYKVRVQPQSGPALTFELPVVDPLPNAADELVSVSLNPAGIVLLPIKRPEHSD